MHAKADRDQPEKQLRGWANALEDVSRCETDLAEYESAYRLFCQPENLNSLWLLLSPPPAIVFRLAIISGGYLPTLEEPSKSVGEALSKLYGACVKVAQAAQQAGPKVPTPPDVMDTATQAMQELSKQCVVLAEAISGVLRDARRHSRKSTALRRRWPVVTVMGVVLIALMGWSYRSYGNLWFEDPRATQVIGDAPWCSVDAFDSRLSCEYYSEAQCVSLARPDDSNDFCVSRPR